jgi:hypothetical protein
MKLVWEHSRHAETDLVVMLALADIANDEGFAWPSIPTLAARARRKERSLIDTLDRLETSKEVFIQRNIGRKNHNQYIVTLGLDAAGLSERLVKYLNYSPDLAARTADDFFSKGAVGCTNADNRKGAVGDENMQPTAPNTTPEKVQSSAKKVQSAAKKGAADCMGTIKEPSLEPSAFHLGRAARRLRLSTNVTR